MILSDEARAARKEAQRERLKAKADKKVDYPVFYADQPLQLARAEVNDQIRQARQLIRQANKDLEISRATGINIVVAEGAVRDAKAALAGLRLLKQTRFKPNVGAALSAGGAT